MKIIFSQAYKAHLVNKGQCTSHGSGVDATTELLSHTSKIIELFQDKHVISSVSDARLSHLSDFNLFLAQWKSSAEENLNVFFHQSFGLTCSR